MSSGCAVTKKHIGTRSHRSFTFNLCVLCAYVFNIKNVFKYLLYLLLHPRDPVRIIGNDPVHAQPDHAAHGFYVVHRPGDEFHAF